MTTDALTGSGSYTVAAGTYQITVRRRGGGGGGGGSQDTTGSNAGGGGAGEFLADTIPVTPGQVFPYACGAGGTATINSVGHAGGDTTFGVLSAAHGGAGGDTYDTGNAPGGAGGTGGSAQVQRDGGAGGAGLADSNGGGGGAPGDLTHPGAAGTGKTGGIGPDGNGGTGGDASNTHGTTGTCPGAGGGGSFSPAGVKQTSSAGQDGAIWVDYTPAPAASGTAPDLDTGSAAVTTGTPAASKAVTIPSGAASVTGEAGGRAWMAPGADVHALYLADATSAQDYFGAGGYVIGTNPSANPVQDGLAATPVLKYVSYAAFAADIANSAITGPYQWVLYDPEYSTGWGTPQGEVDDPWTFLGSFVTLAHAHGFKTILTPGRDLGNSTTSKHLKNAGETLDAWYLRTGIATAAGATGTEVTEIQTQADTTARQGRWGMFSNPGDMGFSDRPAAFEAWETWTGRPVRATGFYLYSIPGAITSDLQYCADHGISVYLSMHPALAGTVADKNALATFLASCKNHGLSIDAVCFYHEPANNGVSQADYIACVKYYNDTVRNAGYPVGFWCSARSCAQQNEDAYFPGKAEVDVVVANFYCRTYLSAGIRLDQVAGIADNAGLPLGIGEYNGNPDYQTEAQITTFNNYARDFFKARIRAGKPNAPCLLFSSDGSSTPDQNTKAITGSGDFRLPLWEDQYDHAWQDGQFVTFFNAAAAQARAAGTGAVWAGLSTNYGRPADQFYAAQRIPSADGFWYNTNGKIADTDAFLALADALPDKASSPPVVRSGVLVLLWCCSGDGTAGPFSAPGFAAIDQAEETNAVSQLLWRIADQSEQWQPGVSQVIVSASAQACFNVHAVTVSDAHPSAPFDPVPAVSGQVNPAALTVAVAGITTAAGPDLALWFAMTAGTPGGGDTPPAITPPAGYTAAGSQVNSSGTGVTNVGSLLAVRDLAAAGATGAADGTISGGTGKYTAGMLIALKSTVVVVVPQAGRIGAFLDLALSGGDPESGVTAFEAATGRVIGIRASSYPLGIIPASASTDDPGGPPSANTVTVANPGPCTAVVGRAVSMQMTASDSDTGITSFAWTAAGLPAGLAISPSTGLITGTPTVQQTVTASVTAADSTGASGSASFAFTITTSVVTGYGFGAAYADAVSAGDAELSKWETTVGRTLRERMFFQGGSFPATFANVKWSGDYKVPRRMHVDVEPAHDGSQVAAFKSFLAAVKASGADVTFRLYHSYAALPSASAFKTAYAYYGPLIKQYGFRLHLSWQNYNVHRGNITTAWIPPGITFDALGTEWYAHQYTLWQDNLDAIATLADGMKIPLGLWEYGANISERYKTVNGVKQYDNTGDQPVTEAQGVAFFKYTRDFFAARIKASKPVAECISWNSLSSSSWSTPGYAPWNQPASWVTWYQRIYDLITKSSPGNPYIW